MINIKATPAIRYGFFLIVGIVLSNYFLFNSYIIFASVIAILLIFALAIKFKFYDKIKNYVALIFILFGIIAQNFNNDLRKPDHIYYQKNIQAYLCNVNSATETKPKSYKVTVEVIAIKKDNKWINASGKSLLYFNKNTENYPEFGQNYVVKGSPRQIEPLKNPYEFDYKKYQARKNIFTHQFLKPNQFVLVGKSNLHPIFEIANRLSNYTHQVFKNIFTNKAELGVSEALVAGIKSEIDQETMQSYSDTGAIHILSVSGGHVMILFVVLNGLFSLLLNKQKFTFSLLVISILWVYALFTGLSPSVCRATLMFTLIQFGTYLNRDKNAINTLAFSAIVLLLINPNWLYDVGFQLSYLAVFGILLCYEDLNNLIKFDNKLKTKPIKWLWEISILSLTAQIFTFPLSIYYFHQFPNVFLLSNPFVSFLAFFIVPLGLVVILFAKIPFIGDALGWIFQKLIFALNYSVEKLQALPYSVTKGLEINILTLILLYVMIVLFYLFIVNKELKHLKYVSILIVLMTSSKFYKVFNQNKTHEITFHFIPKGIGLSIIEGRNTHFISTDSIAHDPMIYQFHLKNYYDHMGVTDFDPIKTNKNSCLNLNIDNSKILWLKSDMKMNIEADTKYILCSNNALRRQEMLDNFKGTLILDGSNNKWFVDKMKNIAANQSYKLITLYDTGSKTFQF